MWTGLHLSIPVTLAIGVLGFAAFAWTAAVSLKEREYRAARTALLLAPAVALPYLLAAALPYLHKEIVCTVLSALTLGAGTILMLPVGRGGSKVDDTPAARIDERDIMFSRMVLQPGSERFERYYRLRPENREIDDAWRAKPGLMGRESAYHDPVTFGAARAGFIAVEQFHRILDGREPAAKPIDPDPVRVTRFVKWWARKLGAVSVGVTELRDYHKYTVIGRGDRYGEPVDLDHRFAVAVTVEMDKAMVDMAPRGATLMESAQQYLHSGEIAVQIAELCRGIGYPARAHIDGGYRVVCPLVARDAGLGEIGRMGLLMTPELGPRVRIAVVTTDLPLVADRRGDDRSMTAFCAICKKCADVCPGRAIPFEDRTEIDGVRRWRIDSVDCFAYWCVSGTDCARCVRVCPYSHPDTPLHALVRAGVRNSSLFRRVALRMDDLLYGRKPPPTPLPDWMQFK